MFSCPAIFISNPCLSPTGWSQPQHVRQPQNPWNFVRSFGNPGCGCPDSRAPFHWGNTPSRCAPFAVRQAFFVADVGGSRENKPFVSQQLKIKNMKSTLLNLAKLLSRRRAVSFCDWRPSLRRGGAGLFLVRVIPKPSRASYPCQRAAFPGRVRLCLWLCGVVAIKSGLKRLARVGSRPVGGC